MIRFNNKGFGSMELAVIALLIGIVTLLGYTAYTKYTQTIANTNSEVASMKQTAQNNADDVPTATKLDSSEDFATIISGLDSLDSTDSSTADTKELDQAIADF